MRNKKLISILMSLCLALTMGISLNTFGVFAEGDDGDIPTIGETLSDEEESELQQDPTDDHNSTVNCTVILNGIDSINIKDISDTTAENYTGSGEDALVAGQDNLEFTTITSGGTIPIQSGGAFMIQGIPDKYLKVVVAGSVDEAANSDDGRIGGAGESIISSINVLSDNGDGVDESAINPIIYVVVYDSLPDNVSDDGTISIDEAAYSEEAPKPTSKQPFPYEAGMKFKGTAVVTSNYLHPHKSTCTFKHTSGILKDLNKKITARCCTPDYFLAPVGTKFNYKLEILKVYPSTGKLKIRVTYTPASRTGAAQYVGYDGHVHTATSKRQTHKTTLTISVKPKVGYVKIKKKSEGQISSGNDMYSVGGAKYQLFYDSACTQGAQFTDGSDAILITNANGESPVYELDVDTYYIKEISAPAGHSLSTNKNKLVVTIKNTETSPLVVTYTNKEKYGDILIEKLDTELNEFASEGDAKIETVQWEVTYFDNRDGSGTAQRTWIFAIPDAEHNGKKITEDMYVSGSPLYKVDGKMVFPLGTYKLREITPVGYIPNDKIEIVHILDSLGATSTKVNVGTTEVHRSNQVIRGGLEVEKHDRETNAHWPMGGASFVGTTFELINSSDKFIYYKKGNDFVLENGQPKKFAPGEVIDTLTINKDGVPATTDTNGDGLDYSLPYGTYTLREVAVDDLEQKHGSYLPTEIEKQTILTVKVREDGAIHTTTDQYNLGNTQDYFYNEVKRGDISIVKTKTTNNVADKYNLKGIPFVIKSKTTGEAHVLVILDNTGYTTTSSDILKHTDNTNYNDYMIDETGMPILNENGWVDTSKIDYYAGIWFEKDSKGNKTVKVDNTKCALPYDTYEIYELPCAINQGYQLWSSEFDITRNELSYRQPADNPEEPLIHTQAKDSVTLDSFGSSESDSIIDTIKYEKFLRGTYLVKTTLMDKETQQPIQVDGKDLTVEKKISFGDGEGEVNVEIKFPKNHLKGKAVVVFEEVWKLDEQGNVVDSDKATTAMDPYVEHKDIKDAGQTVLYPDMHTTAKDKVDMEKDIFANGTQTIVDTVEYKALQTGKEHIIKGVLMDKETGEPLKDAEGNEITAEKAFTPESNNGIVDIEFTFEASLLEGKTVVVFEDLYRDGKEILVHTDIEDEDQSVYLPKIRTKFMTNDGEKDIDFSGLDTDPVVTTPDTTDPTTDSNTPSGDPNGNLDATGVKELVVGQGIDVGYYKLTGHTTDTTNGLAYWAIFFNKDGSVPSERDTDHCVGNGNLTNGSTCIIRLEKNMVFQYEENDMDTITFEKVNAVSNTELDSGIQWFYSERWDDSTNTYKEILMAQSKLKAMAEVQNENTDAANNDTATSDTQPTDTTQTTDNTQPTDTPAETPTEESTGEATVVLVDHVQYWNLIPGKEYEATVGIAKKDGTVLTDDNGNPYEGHFTFVPETKDGEYEVKLPAIPLSKLTDDIVALEVLKSKPAKEEGSTEEPTPKVVAEHKDLTDADQTIMIPKISTSAVDQKDGDKAILGKPDQTLVDTITYEGLIPGGNYIARGKLANPKTGEILKDESGNEVIAETKFVPTESSGTVEVELNFDASEYMAGSVVVLEELYRVPEDTTKPERFVAWHKDLTDTDQTVDVFMELYVTIAKADAEKVKYYLKGAEITVFDGDGNIALDKDGNKCVGVTDKDGLVKFTILYLEGMEFYAQETKAPKGYEINEETFEVKPETLNEEGADILISILDQAIVIPPIKTGDDTNMMLYAILLLVALSAVGTTVFVRRRIYSNK